MPNNDNHLFTFTLFDNREDTEGARFEVEWAEFCSGLSHKGVKSKDNAGLVPATFTGNRRRKRRITEVSGLGLDLDLKSPKDIGLTLDRVSHLEWVMWTTYGYDPDREDCPPDLDKANAYKPARIRVLLPFASPVSAHLAERAWRDINARLGGQVDPQTKDASRFSYLPAAPPARLSRAVVHRNPGKLYAVNVEGGGDDRRTWEVSDFEASAAADKVRSWLVRLPKGSACKESAKRLADGESLAAEGERHGTMRALTWQIAAKWPDLTESTITSLFAPSCAVDPDGPEPSAAWVAYDGALGKIEEGRVAERERKAEETQREQAAAAGYDGGYSDKELQAIAHANGWEVEDLRDKWVLQHMGSVFLLDERGMYRGPYTKDDAGVAAARVLARAPVRMVEMIQDSMRYRAVADYAREAGQVATKIVTDLAAQGTRFDQATETIYEACCPQRNIRPKRDKRLDKWLRLLAGDQYDSLRDWLACAPDLRKLLCALYLHGPKSSGKTLLPVGLARLWTEGPPSDAELALSGFNEDIARCPLILADEELPVRYAKDTVTTKLRSMLSTYSRPLARKYKAPTDMHGAIRLVIAANNPSLLSSKGVSTRHDLEAVAERFLYLKVDTQASEYLETLPRKVKEHWANEGIAAHALWLQKNHYVEPPSKRFWVSGSVGQMHRLLITESHWNSLVCEWLVRYLLDPGKLERGQRPGSGFVKVVQGRLFVAVQGVSDGWDVYMEKAKQTPNTNKLGHALSSLGTGETSRIKVGERKVPFTEVRLDNLVAWAEQSKLCDRGTLESALKVDSSETDT